MKNRNPAMIALFMAGTITAIPLFFLGEMLIAIGYYLSGMRPIVSGIIVRFVDSGYTLCGHRSDKEYSDVHEAATAFCFRIHQAADREAERKVS